MSRTRALLISGILVAVLGGALATLLLVHDRRTPPVPDDASPEQVVRAYLDALGSHDCDTAVALSTGQNATYAQEWCTSLKSITGVVVLPPRKEDPIPTGNPATVEVVNVEVRLHLQWRSGAGLPDPTATDETELSAYLLKRTSPDQPWRIFDEGDS